MKRVLFYLSILILAFFILNGCLVDVIEESEISISALNDISYLAKSIDLTNYPKIKKNDKFPIIAWYSIPDSALNLERFLEAKEAGITLSLFEYSNVDNVQKALDLAEEVGMKILIACPELYTQTESVVKLFKNHPANGGYFIKDEPKESLFQNLSKLVKEVESIDDTRFCYINLLASNAHKMFNANISYEGLVQKFINEIPIKILSFDHYPVLGNYISFDWYQNLEIIRDASIKAEIPFWAFALTSAHWGYPIPTLNHLRLQVYSNLAYGAKGIQYFTYWIPKNTIYNSAPINRKGYKTNEYHLLKEINNEIKYISYIFQTSTVKNVGHYGEVPIGAKVYSNPPVYVKSLNVKGGNALLSVLESVDSEYFMIQNTTLYSDIEIYIEIDSQSNIVLKNGSIIPASLIGGKFKIIPGDMVVFSRSLN